MLLGTIKIVFFLFQFSIVHCQYENIIDFWVLIMELVILLNSHGIAFFLG